MFSGSYNNCFTAKGKTGEVFYELCKILHSRCRVSILHDSLSKLLYKIVCGGLFESFIITDIIKQLYNQAERPHVYFWQEVGTNEIDCIIEKANKRYAVEIKSSQTISKNFFKTLRSWNTFAQTPATHNFLVYTGTQTQPWPDGTVISWLQISDLYAILKS